MARRQKFRAKFALPVKEDDNDAAMELYASATTAGGSTDNEPMTDDELAAIVNGQITDSMHFDSSELSQIREKALKFFDGEVDIPAAPGRSQVVSRDVADVHGLIMPGLMRVFLATDKIAIYEPKTEKDEKFARQATDYVNYVVMRECEGYRQLRSAFHDGLLMGNGILKHWWDFTPEYATEEFSGLSDDAYTMLVADPEVEEVLEHTEYDDPNWVPPPSPPPMAPPPGGLLAGPPALGGSPIPAGLPPVLPVNGEPPMPEAPKLHDCKLKRCVSSGRLRLMAVPPEDFLIGRGVINLEEDRTRFAAHRFIKTRSQLITEGYDEDKIDELPAFQSANIDSPERTARDPEHLFGGDNAPDRSTDLIEGYEAYIQVDYDGDGVAEWRKVVVAGLSGQRSILCNEEWGDELPFSDVVPDPIPHRWRGRSLFDATEDVQRIKTVLMRQTLDNIYLTNTPRQYMTENGVVNPEVLQDFEIGSLVIERAPNSVRFDTTPFVADKSFPIIEYMDSVVEKRTGISRESMALDPEALQDQTATAVNASQAAAHTKVEEYARNIAEHGGLKRVFSKVLKLIVKHQDRARTIRLRDDWVEVDPRSWNANMDVTINTGLGSGSRERDLAMLAQIAIKQEQIVVQMGPTNPVCGVDRLIDTYRLMTEAAGLKPSERFFPEITPQIMDQLRQQAQNQPPDPKVQVEQMRAQIDAQARQQELQLKQQEAQYKQQLAQSEALQKAQLDQEKARQEAAMQQLQLERQAQIEERQANADIAVKQADAEAKMQLAVMDHQFKTQMAQQQFEFDKKLEMLKLWAQCNADACKRSGEQTGEMNPDQGMADMEARLTAEGADLPAKPAVATPLETALAKISESQAQCAQMMAQCTQMMAKMGQNMAAGHAQSTQMIAQALNKPKRHQVLRDEKNRVIGVETVQ